MSKEFVQNSYNEGDVVSAIIYPQTRLVIRRYIDQIYYCRIQGDAENKDLVYFERELVKNPYLIEKNLKARSQEK
ncbi:hypothetical protein [Negadavirga shengliensis]|uniref:Uncharacterized protein n=1 Tax=Negadavirga shengliensis TaxID=1389218 RepID=A0ABV9SZU5_9BACT